MMFGKAIAKMVMYRNAGMDCAEINYNPHLGRFELIFEGMVMDSSLSRFDLIVKAEKMHGFYMDTEPVLMYRNGIDCAVIRYNNYTKLFELTFEDKILDSSYSKAEMIHVAEEDYGFE